MGADALMEKVAAEVQSESGDIDPGAKLRTEIDELIAKSGEMPEKEAAAVWIELFESYLAIPSSKRNNLNNANPPLKLETVFEALPTPVAWDEISAQTKAMADDEKGILKESLMFVSEVLTGDPDTRQAALAALRKSYLEGQKEDSYNVQWTGEYFDQLEVLLKSGVSAEDRIEQFKVQLSKAEQGDDEERDTYPHYSNGYITFPPLAGEITEEEAEALVLRALKLGAEYSCDHEPTRRLIAKVMLANPDEILKPFWDVIETAAEIPLFEALGEKFADQESWEYVDAQGNYVILLMMEGELEKARAYLMKNTAAGGKKIDVDYGAILETKDAAAQEAAMGLFAGLLKEDAGYPYWRAYIEFAEKTGKSEEALVFLGEAIAAAKEGTDLEDELRGYYLEGLLGAEKIDEALVFLREMVAQKAEKEAVTSESQADQYLESSLRLAKMARLLEKPDLVEEAFTGAKEAVKLNRRYTDSGYSETNRLVLELVKQGRGVEAEEVLAEELVFMSRAVAENRRYRKEAMTPLAYVYSEAGRHQDVVDLLEKSTMWDAGDLSDLADSSFDSKPLMLMAAESLHAVGRSSEASKILDRVLAKSPGLDAAYELLLAIGGEEIVEKLDRLSAENRFQERPLIWKAKYLLNSGKADEAEEVAKAAIAVDPSDGEQGKGDRMRVYAVLAEIMEAKGDSEQAEFLKSVVRAIRKSEMADDWWSAGMQKRAIVIYEESLNEFADAYCIQSRLALRYNEMGEHEKAEEHYRRAFELMPSSFGRVESHCFGCEGAFSGEMAQGIAERVFLKLAEEMPDKAQVFYLLGYLRDAQGRAADAVEYFTKAVELDPDYINAWDKLKGLADEAGLSAEEKDRIALELFRLNPYGTNLGEVSDIAKLWEVALEADKNYVPDETGPVFKLSASSAPVESNRYSYYSSYGQKTAPRKQIATHQTLRQVIQLTEYIWRD